MDWPPPIEGLPHRCCAIAGRMRRGSDVLGSIARRSIIPIRMGNLFWRSSNSISELESSLAVYEPLVWISGALVLLGVVLEVVADRRAAKNSGNLLKKWGEYLLIFGLAGEIAFGIAAAVLSGIVIAKLHLATADAEARTAELQSILGPRHLTKDHLTQVKDRLSQFSGVAADLFVFDGDEWTRFESLNFSRSLSQAMDGAGVDTRSYWGIECGITQSPLVGVNVITDPHATEKELLAASEIIKLLPTIGIEKTYFPRAMPACQIFAGGAPDPKKPARKWANIKIMIGNKPPAMLSRPTVQDFIQPVPPH